MSSRHRWVLSEKQSSQGLAETASSITYAVTDSASVILGLNPLAGPKKMSVCRENDNSSTVLPDGVGVIILIL